MLCTSLKKQSNVKCVRVHDLRSKLVRSPDVDISVKFPVYSDNTTSSN